MAVKYPKLGCYTAICISSSWAAKVMFIKSMKSFFLNILLLLIISGCVSKPSQDTSLVSRTATFPSNIDKTSTSSVLLPTQTRTPTQEPPMVATSIPPTIPVATLNALATLEPLEKLCDEYQTDSSRYSEISPNGEWYAISCGYKRNQKLIVQNLEGIKWVINFSDFFDSKSTEWSGGFVLLGWSFDGRFLYFSKMLGVSGGGNQCFPGFGVLGLYRLHLKTGTLTTLISTNKSFPGDGLPGYKIRFSPNNEYYAVNKNGVTITNLVNDKVTVIDTSGVMEMIWSPDSRFLTFSVASCGEDLVESSSIYIWDSSTSETQVLFSTNKMLLRPDSWVNMSTLRFKGENWDYQYTVFEYDLAKNEMILSGTATPRP